MTMHFNGNGLRLSLFVELSTTLAKQPYSAVLGSIMVVLFRHRILLLGRD